MVSDRFVWINSEVLSWGSCNPAGAFESEIPPNLMHTSQRKSILFLVRGKEFVGERHDNY